MSGVNIKGKAKRISIIVPVYNEEENVMPLYHEVCGVFNDLDGRYLLEFIFSDNHSADMTYNILEDLAGEDKRVKVIRLSKNFGYQRSIYTAYTYATGDAAVQLDCDLQDPPSLIPQLIKKWEDGFLVVYGVRRLRQEGWVLNTIRKGFYRLINFLSEDQLPHDAGDFRLIDRRILDELKRTSDTNPYLRGTIASFGFRQTGISYDRQNRGRGYSKFNLVSLVNLAIDGILNHSIVPLRIATFTGVVISVIMLLAVVGYFIARITFGQNWPSGFTTTTMLILFSIILNAIFLGIIGEYIGRIYQQVKNRPITIVERTVNID